MEKWLIDYKVPSFSKKLTFSSFSWGRCSDEAIALLASKHSPVKIEVIACEEVQFPNFHAVDIICIEKGDQKMKKWRAK